MSADEPDGAEDRTLEKQMAMQLFDSVAPDHFHFGYGPAFEPQKVVKALGFKNQDVSRIAAVAPTSVRYDQAIPAQVRERLEEIGNTINMVASVFQGDVAKTVAWFQTPNPLLGDVSPKDMIRLGRYLRLRKFIVNAMMDEN